MYNKRERRTYTEEFKKQIVSLYLNGKSRADLIKEYELTGPALAKWITTVLSRSNDAFKLE